MLPVLRWAAGEVADVLSADLAVTGLDVHADLCVHGARLPRSPLHFDGVTLATPDSLLEVPGERGAVLPARGDRAAGRRRTRCAASRRTTIGPELSGDVTAHPL